MLQRWSSHELNESDETDIIGTKSDRRGSIRKEQVENKETFDVLSLSYKYEITELFVFAFAARNPWTNF